MSRGGVPPYLARAALVLPFACSPITSPEADISAARMAESAAPGARFEMGSVSVNGTPAAPEALPPVLPVCAPGEQRCAAGLLERCRADLQGFELEENCGGVDQCDAASGSCSEPCLPGTTRCSSRGALQHCSDRRLGWQLIEQCGNALLCDAGARHCKSKVCNAGDLSCGTDALGRSSVRRCAPGGDAFSIENVCDPGSICRPLLGRCERAECDPGDVRCGGPSGTPAVQRCSSQRDGFVLDHACAVDEICNPERAACQQAACAAGEFRCGSLGTLASVELCRPERADFAVLEVCAPDEICDATNPRCAPRACVPDQLSCGTDALGRAIVRRCAPSGDAFSVETTCEQGQICQPLTLQCGQAACGDGQLLCRTEYGGRAAVLRCRAEHDGFVLDHECAPGEVCNPESAQCQPPPCAPGAYRCGALGSFATVELCTPDGARFDVIEACTPDETCNPAGPRCEPRVCVPDALSCGTDAEGQSIVRRCAPGGDAFSIETTCPPEQICQTLTQRCGPAACGEGQLLCRAPFGGRAAVLRCSRERDGFVLDRECAAGEICDPQTAQCQPPLCAPGESRCGSLGALATVQLCMADRAHFEIVAVCEAGEVCDPLTARCAPRS